MTTSTLPEPHRILIERPWWCLIVAAVSVLVSAWAVYLDPVVDGADVGDLQAARHFAAGQWRAAMGVAEGPLFALLVALLGGLTGLSASVSAHALGAVFFAALVIGFAALAGVGRGGRMAQLLAVVLMLLYPALNGFRSSAGGDAGYWAFYLWSMAYMIRYTVEGARRDALAWLACGIAGALLAAQMMVFVLIVPLWLRVRSIHVKRPWLVKLAALAAAGVVLLVYVLWQHAIHAGTPAGQVLAHPVDQALAGWHELERSLRFKLESLREGFLDRFSQNYDHAAFLAALLWMAVAGLLKALGPVHAVLAAYTATAARGLLTVPVYRTWFVFTVVGLAVLPAHAVARLDVGQAAAMPAALTLLAPVPLILERWWRNWADNVAGYRWILPVVMLLVVASGVRGLDLRDDDHYIRRAAAWIHETAAPDSSLYSNSRALMYYAHLNTAGPRSEHSWRRVMNLVQRKRWREHDYLAVSIPRGKAHREGILNKWIDAEPVKVFRGERGGRVLVFRGRR